VELAIFLQRELIASHGLELWTLVKTLAGGNVAFFDGVIHHRTEDGHLKADGVPAKDREGREIVVLFVQGKGKSVGEYLERIRVTACATLDRYVGSKAGAPYR
jgi:hypothetical protein